MEDIGNQIGSPVQQNNMSADNDMREIWRRRRQAPLKIRRARLDFFLQSRRKRSSHNELPFQTWRQLVAFGQTGREVIAMVGVPAPHSGAVIISEAVVPIVGVTVFIFVVAVAVTLAVPLRLSAAGDQ